MARSKLLAALDNQNGRDYKLERQKTLQKKAARRKTSKVPVSDVELKENHQTHTDGSTSEADAGDDDTDIDEAVGGVGQTSSHQVYTALISKISTSRIDDTESESDSSGEPVEDAELDNKEASGKDETAEIDEEDVDEDVPLSQVGSLMSDEENDIVPHQRLTINNTSALQKAHKSFALKYSEIPFCAHQVVTTIEPVAIADVDDDLTRELAFYKQCLDAANKGRTLLKKEGVSFSRPTDYFAEMVKSDEHMGKIKEKMTDEAANKKAAADARKQRDLKKFGKQVQVVKLQERDKAKRETLNKIDILKRSMFVSWRIDHLPIGIC